MATNGTPLRSFARSFGSGENTTTTEERPSADVWMNVGYAVEVPATEEGEEPTMRFIGVPLGIALDTQKPIDTSKTRSAELLEVQTFQNKLLEDLQQHAQSLQPGEEQIINLQVQIRRVKGPIEAPVANASSVFARPMSFVAPSA